VRCRLGNRYRQRASLGLRDYSEWKKLRFKKRDRDWNKVEGGWRQKAASPCRRIRVTRNLNRYYLNLQPKKTEKKDFFRTGGKSRWLLACLNTGPQPLQILTRGEKPRKPIHVTGGIITITSAGNSYITNGGVEMIEIAPHRCINRGSNEKRPAGQLFDAIGAVIWKRYAPGKLGQVASRCKCESRVQCLYLMSPESCVRHAGAHGDPRKITAAYESSASTSQEPLWRAKRREWIRIWRRTQAELVIDKKAHPEYWARAEQEWPSDPAPIYCFQEPPPYHPPEQSQYGRDPIVHYEILERRNVTPASSIGIGPLSGVGRLLRSVWGAKRGGPHHMFDKTRRVIKGIGDDLDRLAVSATIDATTEVRTLGRELDPTHELIISHLPLAIKIAKGFRDYNFPMEDLIAEGRVGLVRATKKYDPQKGAFATYAVHWITAAIYEYIQRSWSVVKMGTTANLRKLFFNLHKAQSQLEDWEGGTMRDDQIKQVAKSLGVTEKDVREMEQRLDGGDVSLNARISDDEGGDYGNLQDMIEDGKPDPETQLIAKEESENRRGRLLKHSPCSTIGSGASSRRGSSPTSRLRSRSWPTSSASRASGCGRSRSAPSRRCRTR